MTSVPPDLWPTSRHSSQQPRKHRRRQPNPPLPEEPSSSSSSLPYAPIVRFRQILTHTKSRFSLRASDGPAPPELPPPTPLFDWWHKLPADVWRIVLGHAAGSLPDPILPDTAHNFLNAPDFDYAAYRQGKHTALACMLVSKEMADLTRPCLYHFAWLRSPQEAKMLAYALTFDAAKQQQRVDQMARYVHHIRLEGTHGPIDIMDVKDIIERTHQLWTYADHHALRRPQHGEWSPEASPAGLMSILAHPERELRHLHWSTYDELQFDYDMLPALRIGGAFSNLEYLDVSTWSGAYGDGGCSDLFIPPGGINTSVSLPSVRSVRASLDDITFLILSHWDLPSLVNLDVTAHDFSFAGPGFVRFFEVHGAKVLQLELSQPSGHIAPQRTSGPAGLRKIGRRLRLAEAVPNLKKFICCALAEWTWTAPDGIAPHALLRAHPNLEFVAIRNLDKRLNEGDVLARGPHDREPPVFFALLEQLGSLFRPEAFPKLRFVRDMSEESHRIRSVHPQQRVTSFWLRVLARCREAGVWIEDWEGFNVTLPGLKRASLGLAPR